MNTFILLAFIYTTMALAQGTSANDCAPGCSCTKTMNGGLNTHCLNAGFTKFPENISHLTTAIDLSGNPLAEIEAYTFQQRNLSNIEAIIMRRCSIRAIDTYAFSGLPRLFEINLSHNLLSSVPTNALDSTPQLRELVLSGNPMLILENNAFVAVSQLIKLEMSDAQIKMISPRAFYGLELLEWLKLDGNLLESIGASALSTLRNVRRMELHHNPWQCTCAVRPLRNFATANKVFVPLPPVCLTPTRLKGRSWQRLPIEELACTPIVSLSNPITDVFIGDELKLQCRVEANPPPAIMWLHDGVEILVQPQKKTRVLDQTDSEERETTPMVIYKKEPKKLQKGGKHLNKRDIHETKRVSIFEAGVTEKVSELLVRRVTLEDLGNYTCSATNRGGRTSATVIISLDSRDAGFHYTAVKGISGFVLLAAAVVLLCLLIYCCVCSVRLPKSRAKDEEEEKDAEAAKASSLARKQFVFMDDDENITTSVERPSALLLGSEDSDIKVRSEVKEEKVKKAPTFESALREMRASLTESDHRGIALKLGVLKRRTSNASEFSEASGVSNNSLNSLITEQQQKRGVDRYRLVCRRGSADIYAPEKHHIRFKEQYMNQNRQTGPGSDDSKKPKRSPLPLDHYPDLIENARYKKRDTSMDSRVHDIDRQKRDQEMGLQKFGPRRWTTDNYEEDDEIADSRIHDISRQKRDQELGLQKLSPRHWTTDNYEEDDEIADSSNRDINRQKRDQETGLQKPSPGRWTTDNDEDEETAEEPKPGLKDFEMWLEEMERDALQDVFYKKQFYIREPQILPFVDR